MAGSGSIMKVSEVYEKEVYTDDGVYFGKIGDVVLGKYMIHGWLIKASPSSLLKRTLGGVKAVIVPHKAVRAIGDIMIIVHTIEISEEDKEAQEREEEEIKEEK